MDFQCRTCNQALNAEQMMKHLSITRHKTVFKISSGEDICCEECQDTNIHQLQIIRFGGEDMILLCNSCFRKDYSETERPATSYSLQNGSILKFWEKYVKVRDCCCDICGEESRLNVNRTGEVLCDKCLPKSDKSKGFISEKSGRFLYIYLGLNETPNSTRKPSKKGGRRVSRGKKGEKAGKFKKDKKETFEDKISRIAYQVKKENSIIQSSSNSSLKNFKGFKAVESDSNIAVSFSNRAKANKSEAKKNNPGSLNGKKGKENRTKTNKKSENEVKREKENTSKNKKNNENEVKRDIAQIEAISEAKKKVSNQAKAKLDSKSKVKPVEKAQEPQPKILNAITEAANKTTLKKSKLKADQNQKIKKNIKGNADAQQSKLNLNGKRSTVTKKPNNKPDKTNSKWTIGSDGDSSRESSVCPTEKVNANNKMRNQQKKVDNKKVGSASKEKSVSQVSPKKSETNLYQDKDIEKTKNSGLIYEEGEPLTKYNAFKPTLSYPDLNTYLNDYSYALFLEQKLENDFMQNFSILWPRNERETAFIINVDKNNNPELEKLLPPNLLALGRPAFNERQPFFFCTQDEQQMWYIFIKELSIQRGKYVLLAELFSWNNLGLPTKNGSSQFKLLPTSAQTSRILFAMTRITNPKFIDLLLGQKPIKQIYFDNRLKFSSDKLNQSQKTAVEHVLNNSITILQGPPGTGKTSTIEEIIIQVIERFHAFPILCVAASNIAIDNIAEKILENRPQIKILRILSKKKEQQYGEDHPLGGICLHNIVYKNLSPDMKLVANRARRGEMISKSEDTKYYKEKTRITNKIVSLSQIIFTTNIAAGGRELKVIKECPVVIMDESTQSSEASTLVPLSLPGIRNFVFVGDEKQLSSFSNIPQLEASLFERVLSNGTYKKPLMLDTQYRMHPKISEFPIKKIYNGELRNGVTEQQKAWPGVEHPLFFYQCDLGPESRVRSTQRDIVGFTYENRHECQEIVKIVQILMLDKKVPLEEIGVVTPYSAQRDLLSEVLTKNIVINPKQVSMEQEYDEIELFNAAGSQGASSLQNNVINIINGLHVATVDSFQGHEKSFIIFSCVRNNSDNKIGFLRDKRRLNVALTRAKHGLIVVGNKNVLQNGDPLWRDYIAYLEEQDVIFTDLAAY
ncbi:RNA helicase [Saccharomyces eubayanus]|uniref:RNA helicase n=1 Tax=Saccharomyces eubayanus TaxID=1080349 RepID=UPI0006C60D50|nr:ECM32-like protein [Saccharomyces eubayanus]KOH00122.1 ECM32-like protein [Saccharomyces eubayanus]